MHMCVHGNIAMKHTLTLKTLISLKKFQCNEMFKDKTFISAILQILFQTFLTEEHT